jgi:hypothetical protein
MNDFSDVQQGLLRQDVVPIRVCIVTGTCPNMLILTLKENFLPKIDGVTRTLARLLDHLREKGHEALIVGPDNGLVISPQKPPTLLIAIRLRTPDSPYVEHGDYHSFSTQN